MKILNHGLAAAVLAIGLSAPASAGQVRLEIRDGLVTLEAKDASPREILAEWARVGQTRIVNAERVPGGPVTLSIEGVPEAKALDMILRSVAGYLAAPRPVAMPSASRYDRIVVMAVARPAVAPAPPASTPASSTFERPGQRYNFRQPAAILDDQDEPVQEEQQHATPAGSAPQPGMPTAAPTPSPAQQAAPTGPGAVTPGMPTAAPTAPRPGMPTAPPKPPGGPGGEQGSSAEK